MLAKTHFAFGFLAALLLVPIFNPVDKILFFAIVLIGALLPDIDTPNSTISHKVPVLPWLIKMISRHRGIFHSVWMCLAISVPLAYFVAPVYGVAMAVGYVSHLLSDGFTKEGINFIHPLGQLRLAGFIETGKTGELVLFL